MPKPEYIPSSDVTKAKAKINRSYDLLEQEINGLDNFVSRIKESVISLSESYKTELGITKRRELMEKIESIEDSILRIQTYFHNIGGKPNIKTENGKNFISEFKGYKQG